MLRKMICCLAVLVASSIWHTSTTNGQTINAPNYTLDHYYTITNAGTGSGADGLAIGNGGAFGNDLFVADFGTFTGGDGIGRVWRITDSNNDGVGEGSVFVSAAGTPFRSPISLTFGLGGTSPFGDNLYLLDYPSSSAQRFVFEVNPSGTVTQHSTASVFNPDGLEAHPDGQRFLINDASTFTVFGGGDDATIRQVNGSGAVSSWADGSNNANGLWDINNEAVFSPDDWYTISNHGVGGSFLREVLQFKDLNFDGDANDAGESRVLIGLGAPNIGSGFGFDLDGNLLLGSGNDLYRYTDLNNDGNYWDFGANTFDSGEQFLLAEDLGTSFIQAIAQRDNQIFVSGINTDGTSSIFLITSVPEPSSAALLSALGLGIAVSRRRRRQNVSE